MKRKLLIILMALGLLALLPATALAANGVLSGNGDVNDPYIIEDEEDLATFRDSVNSGNTYAGKYIELRANKTYDLSGQAWTPIGNSARETIDSDTKYFAGHFDGKNATITGLNNQGYVPISDSLKEGGVEPDEYLFGLFGFTSNATIANLNLVDVNIDASIDADSNDDNEAYGDGVAALVGYSTNALTVDNVAVSGTIKGYDSVAGIVGRAYGTETKITDCINDADISHTKANGKAGGIIGIGSQDAKTITVINCHNTGDVTGGNVGGIIGYLGNVTTALFEDCSNSGAIIGNVSGGASYVGGIVGYDSGFNKEKQITFQNCLNSGTITAEINKAGGIAGILGGSVEATNAREFTGCTNFGSVSGQETAAGIVANSQGQLTVTDCHSMGNISARDTAAGIVGRAGGGPLTIDSCTVSGTLNTTNTAVTSNGSDVYNGTMRGVAVGMVNSVTTTVKNMSDYGEYELIADIYTNRGVVGEADDYYTLDNCTTQNTMRWMNNAGYIDLRLVNCQLAGLVQNGRALQITADADTTIGELVAGAKYDYENMAAKWASNSTATVRVASGTMLTVATAEEFSATEGIYTYSGTIVGTDATSYLNITEGTAEWPQGVYQWEGSKWAARVAQVGDNYYPTIQAAISAVTGTGEKVTVLADVTLDAPLDIAGKEDLTIAGANGATITTSRNDKEVFTGTPSGDFTLQELTFTNAVITINGAAGVVTVDGCTFQDTQSPYSTKLGALNLTGCQNGSSLVVKDSVFTNLTKGTGDEFVGVYTLGTLESISVTGSTFSDIAGTALSLRGTDTMTITGNTFENWANGSANGEGRVVRADFTNTDSQNFVFNNNKLIIDRETTDSYVKITQIDDVEDTVIDVDKNYWAGKDPVDDEANTGVPVLEIALASRGDDEPLTAEELKDSELVTGQDQYYTEPEMRPSDLNTYVPSTPTYRPIIDDTDNGTVSVRPSRPERGDKVTIIAKPDDGYIVDEVSVVDRDGDKVDVTANTNGTYSFIQPRGSVTISVTFRLDICDGGRDCPSYGFIDVDQNLWYHEAVDYVIEHQVMNGTSATTFAPTGTLSRAMLVQILYNSEGRPSLDDEILGYPYADVPGDAWFADAVYWARLNNVVLGYGDENFGPNDPITREQLMTILYRYEQLQGGGFTGDWAFNLDFNDADQVSDWAYEATCWCTMNGVVTGYGNDMLLPQGTATRAEVAQMIMRFLELERN